MLISEGLNARVFGADMSSNQFGTDVRSLQLHETLLEEHNVGQVFETSPVDGLVNFEADVATPKIVDEALAVTSRMTKAKFGKRKSKPTERWLTYQTSQLDEKRRKLNSRLPKKSSAVDGPLYLVRNVEAVREQMLQIDGVFQMSIEVHRENNSSLPLEMQEQDEDWFDDIDEKLCHSKIRSTTG